MLTPGEEGAHAEAEEFISSGFPSLWNTQRTERLWRARAEEWWVILLNKEEEVLLRV